ncbi:hypothetical protein J4416_01070 [Candidatus Pacearchaeota archaeon]|nr:hypothetical protein [Candidatus Pacearchaeota archaeon]HLC73147.1 hypothetical protein [Candidatus Nanoarchaeia archaeon]
MDRNQKKLLIIDSVVVIGSLLTLFFLVGYTQPLVIAPFSDGSTENSLIFSLPSIDYLLLDNNIKFDSPQTIFVDDVPLNLEPGRYYIKVISGLSGEIREINTELSISLEIRRLSDGSVGVFNIGKSNLVVETYKIGTIVNSSLVYTGSSSFEEGGGK